MFATVLLLIWSYDMPSVSFSWGTVSAEFNGHRIRLNYRGPFWRAVQLDGDVEVPWEAGERQLEKGRERPEK